MTIFEKENLITSKEELKKVFFNGCKNSQKIGMEYEKLAVYDSNYTAVDYYSDKGIKSFLLKLKNILHSEPIYEEENIIGLVDDIGQITLEPGAQVELSISPKENILDFYEIIEKYNKITDYIAHEMNFSFIYSGLHPISTYENINVIPKKRYKYMGEYLPKRASLPFVMMRETAGIQIAIDFENEEDAIEKFSLGLKLSPFLTGLFSNSPFRNGKLTKYKSFRALSWLNTDNERCGLISKQLIENPQEYSFNDYIDYLINIPMIFYKNEFVGSKIFKEQLYSNNPPDLNDWYTQISLNFSDVRLKPNYLELRNHDLQRSEYLYAIPAIYKGIMYSKEARNEVNELLKRYKYEDYKLLASLVPVFASDICYKRLRMFDVLKEIVNISKRELKKYNFGEERFLEPIEQLINNNLVPADIAIKQSNKGFTNLINYLANKEL